MKNIVLMLPHSVLAALQLPIITLALTVGVFVADYQNFIITGVILMFSAVICFIVLLGRFIAGLYDLLIKKKKADRQLIITGTSIMLTLLLIPGFLFIEYASAYVMVRYMEPYLLHKAKTTSSIHSDTNSSFRYFRLKYGLLPRGGNWLVYDESDQVSLDYMERSPEWWQVSKEAAETESCLSNGTRVYSHYYFQTAICR